MLEARCDERFAPEAELVDAGSREQLFDGDVAVKIAVVRARDASQAAATMLSENMVPLPRIPVRRAERIFVCPSRSWYGRQCPPLHGRQSSRRARRLRWQGLIVAQGRHVRVKMVRSMSWLATADQSATTLLLHGGGIAPLNETTSSRRELAVAEQSELRRINVPATL